MIYCGQCGHENDEDAIFCKACGARLDAPEETFSEEEEGTGESHPGKKKNTLLWVLALALVAANGIYFGKTLLAKPKPEEGKKGQNPPLSAPLKKAADAGPVVLSNAEEEQKPAEGEKSQAGRTDPVQSAKVQKKNPAGGKKKDEDPAKKPKGDLFESMMGIWEPADPDPEMEARNESYRMRIDGEEIKIYIVDSEILYGYTVNGVYPDYDHNIVRIRTNVISYGEDNESLSAYDKGSYDIIADGEGGGPPYVVKFEKEEEITLERVNDHQINFYDEAGNKLGLNYLYGLDIGY